MVPKSWGGPGLILRVWGGEEESIWQFAAFLNKNPSTNDGVALAVVTGSPFRDIAGHIVNSVWTTILSPDTYFGPTWTRLQRSKQVSRIRKHVRSPRKSASIRSASSLFPFCFCWQAVTLPSGERISVEPIHVDGREIGIQSNSMIILARERRS